MAPESHFVCVLTRIQFFVPVVAMRAVFVDFLFACFDDSLNQIIHFFRTVNMKRQLLTGFVIPIRASVLFGCKQHIVTVMQMLLARMVADANRMANAAIDFKVN